MTSKTYFNFVIGILFLGIISFCLVSACEIGETNPDDATQYCDYDGTTWVDLKLDGDTSASACLNDFECKSGACTEGYCGSLYSELQKSNEASFNKLLADFWCKISPIPCSGEDDGDDGDDGSDGDSPGGPSGGNNGDNYGSPACNPDWKCTNWSSKTAGGLLCGSRICTKKNAQCPVTYTKPAETLDCGYQSVEPDSYCGDGVCDDSETQYSCSDDCGSPEPTKPKIRWGRLIILIFVPLILLAGIVLLTILIIKKIKQRREENSASS